MKHIEQEWIEYQRRVLPRDASDVQIRECKRAFFAGAHALYSIQITQTSQGSEITEADLNLVEAIRDELSEFCMDQFGKAVHV